MKKKGVGIKYSSFYITVRKKYVFIPDACLHDIMRGPPFANKTLVAGTAYLFILLKHWTSFWWPWKMDYGSICTHLWDFVGGQLGGYLRGGICLISFKDNKKVLLASTALVSNIALPRWEKVQHSIPSQCGVQIVVMGNVAQGDLA